jgi:cytochrome c551
MNRWVVRLIATVLLLFVTACGGGDNAQEADPAPAAPAPEGNQQQEGTADAAAGEKLYKQSCAGCHGVDLSGTAGPALTQVGAKYSQEEILQIIEQGQGAMPPGLLKGEDAEAVATWLAGMK